MDDARLRTVWQQRQVPGRSAHLSEPITLLMKHTLQKKVRQLGKLGEIWDEVVPQSIAAHTTLENFSRGVLTVLVDSSAHRFQLQTHRHRRSGRCGRRRSPSSVEDHTGTSRR